MWWMAAFAAAQSLEQGRLQKGQAKIDKVTMKSNVKVENMRREANNILTKAQGDLARYQQARGNKYKLIQGAQQQEAQKTNMLRLTDAAVRGSFESRIAASEEAGALVAAAGAAGIGGGSLDMLNATTRMRQQRAQQAMDSQVNDQLYDMQLNLDRTAEATILGLDDVQFFDNINYMTAQEQYIREPSWLEIGGKAAMTFAETYAKTGGGTGWGAGGNPFGGLFKGGTPAVTGATQAGYDTSVLSGWSGPTIRMK